MKIENKTKERIIMHAKEKFFTYGISKVTMEEIASDLKISKKTLYKYFSNKMDLFRSVIDYVFFNVSSALMTVIENENLEFVDKLKNVMIILGKILSSINLDLINDIRKVAPDMWEILRQKREENIVKNFGKLIEDGKNSGKIKKQFNQEIILGVFLGAIDHIVTPYKLVNYPVSAKEIFETIINILLDGILEDIDEKKIKNENIVDKSEFVNYNLKGNDKN